MDAHLQQRFVEHWLRLAPRRLDAGVMLAVSGGVDSMVLAHLVFSTGIRCAIAHVNFGLRGEASEGDERFVREWTESRRIPFHTVRFDTKGEASARGKGVQETARALRYTWFEKVRAANGYSAILTAHHTDDNAETFLLNLFRGAGLTGLGGIPEVSGFLRRPLLHFRKDQLIAFAESQNISFRTDDSNEGSDYRRNEIRHSVMPALEEVFPDASSKLASTAMRLRGAGELYKVSLQKRLRTLVDLRGPDTYVPIRALRMAEPLATLCHEIFSPAGFTSAQLPQIIALMEAETGRYVSSATHRVIRHRDHLVIAPAGTSDTALIVVEGFPALVETSTHRYRFSKETQPQKVDEGEHVAWLDESMLQGPIILRRTRAGDYFYPLGMGRKKKKVARFLTSAKLPRHEKEQAWVLESGGRIAWVAGHRIDERFKISASTSTAIRIERASL